MSSSNGCTECEEEEMQLKKKRVKVDGSQEEEARATTIFVSSSLSLDAKEHAGVTALTSLAVAAAEYQQQQQQQEQQQQQQQQRLSVVLPICTNSKTTTTTTTTTTTNTSTGSSSTSSTSTQGQFLEEGIAPFVTKLYELVSNKDNNNLISWSEEHGGQAFVVYDPVEFASTVLPRFFKHSNFCSFVRQLNIYGFHKVESKRGYAFQHEFFKVGAPHLLKNIQRRKSVHKKITPQKSGTVVPAGISMGMNPKAVTLQGCGAISMGMNIVGKDFVPLYSLPPSQKHQQQQQQQPPQRPPVDFPATSPQGSPGGGDYTNTNITAMPITTTPQPQSTSITSSSTHRNIALPSRNTPQQGQSHQYQNANFYNSSSSSSSSNNNNNNNKQQHCHCQQEDEENDGGEDGKERGEMKRTQVEELRMRHRAWMSRLDEEEEIAHKYCMDEISRLQQQSKDTHAMLLQLKGILDQAKLDNESKYYK